MDKKTNEEILHMVHEDRKILDNMEMSTQMVGQNAARYITICLLGELQHKMLDKYK